VKGTHEKAIHTLGNTSSRERKRVFHSPGEPESVRNEDDRYDCKLSNNHQKYLSIGCFAGRSELLVKTKVSRGISSYLLVIFYGCFWSLEMSHLC